MKPLQSCAVVVAILVGATGSVKAECPGNWGATLGTFRGVLAYSNGTDTGCSNGLSSYGYKYQCVEFVKRFYGEEVEDPINTLWGEARYAYSLRDNSDASPDLVAYPQGGNTKPRAGDLLCFGPASGYSNVGHVGIISEVGTNYVKMIDQNRATSSTANPIQLSLSPGTPYSIGTFSAAYAVQGWLRDPDYPSHLFTLAHARNGGTASVGTASGPIYDYGPYRRQDFTGGAFGNCCIMYDPNNETGNAMATNEAYLLRTGFYEHYFANGGWNAFGCPTRDEYAVGEPGDAIQFFFRVVWDEETNRDEPQQHHMYYDASQPSGQRVSWHSTYAYTFVSASPSGVTNIQQGDAFTAEFKVTNMSQFIWRNNQSSYPYDYAYLQSCDVNGAIVPSFLYDSSWLNTLTPCAMLESSVAPGATATFRFTGRVSSTASVGAVSVYFRPMHSVGGVMAGWSTSFKVDLFVEPRIVWQFAGDISGDGKGDVLLVATNGTHLYKSTGSAFSTPELVSSWVPTGMRCLMGDVRGLGKKQLISVNPNDGIFVQTYDAAANPKLSAPLRVSNWTPLATDSIAVGDVDRNGKDDIVITRSSGEYVLLSTGTWLNLQTWKTGWSSWPYQLLIGDWDPDQYADIIISRETGTYYQYSTGSYFGNQIQLSSWSPYSDPTYVGYFTADDRICLLRSLSSGSYLLVAGVSGYLGPYQWSTWSPFPSKPLVADVNGDGLDDVIGVFPVTRQIAVLTSTGGSFSGPSTWYTGSGAAQPFSMQPVLEEPAWRLSFSVRQNPVRADATFRITLPMASQVFVDIYDVRGRRVESIQRSFGAGEHEVSWRSREPAGVYLARLRSNAGVVRQKIVLLR